MWMSPVLVYCIAWWNKCLDGAQLPEGGNADGSIPTTTTTTTICSDDSNMNISIKSIIVTSVLIIEIAMVDVWRGRAGPPQYGALSDILYGV